MTKSQQRGWSAVKSRWIVGGAAVVLIATSSAIANAAQHTGPTVVAVDASTSQSSREAATTSASPRATPTPTPTPTPVIETKLVLVDEPVAFAEVRVDDPNAAVGTSAVTTAGVNGVRTKTFRVTLRDGVEIARTMTANVVSRPPVNRVTSVGTQQPAPPPAAEPPASAPSGGCDPNYSGCVPIASDVDCAGGSGNGPAYVRGPVTVVGNDIYDLDRDGDGTACE
ncbi:G5 domain-containing protein [Leifsonia poae]|uniref:G5 domain-containing protein n=1 Tax=Leifsonia poae TaxID=110933 RepID=A0A9W6H6T3_9MICO|nr:G5 domain-containing protein [Leifsonia poae]GLJ74710.1 hypothetical protein GCM10017584_02830 [Leifsonia poae]